MADEKNEAEIPPEAPPQAEWQKKTEFAINGKMREAVHLSISAFESELTLLRRKLAKLQYGS
jgi:hypothetical protein